MRKTGAGCFGPKIRKNPSPRGKMVPSTSETTPPQDWLTHDQDFQTPPAHRTRVRYMSLADEEAVCGQDRGRIQSLSGFRFRKASAMSLPDVTWTRPLRAVGEVSIVHVDLGTDERNETAALVWLDSPERQRWERYRNPRARREFALCRAALRSHLCDRLGCSNDRLAFGKRAHGKPFAVVDETEVSYGFNVSHGGRHGLIGFLADPMLGVDIEERIPRSDVDGIGAYVFGHRERSVLAAAEGHRKLDVFYRMWTLKEALIKALGTGFSCNPATFEVPREMLDGARSGRLRLHFAPSGTWNLVDIGEAEFAAAVAYRAEAD
ncbi:MAG: 4'-phosphopantetheinyl transferase superfamily protein [Gammaproteobacteria bacterium]|nr:4'-phosphopantetheinyl transferase superfamily protein [Gammaproteobacteria bacterium]